MCAQKVKGKAVLAALSITLMGFGHAANAAIIFLDDVRGIAAGAFGWDTQDEFLTDGSEKIGPGDFSDFDELAQASISPSGGSASAIAQQTSQINATSILASGEVTANAELIALNPDSSSFVGAEVFNSLFLEFELTTPYHYDLSGILGSSNLSDGAQVSLYSKEGSFSVFVSGSDETIPFDLSGTLSPDIYVLDVVALENIEISDIGTISASSNFSLDLQFTPVPIPASLLLFGSGLLGIIGIARRKKAA